MPGTGSQRKGRNDRQQKRYIIVPTEAAWVVRIFNWFVIERKSLNWIARELTRGGAPKDHRSTTPQWTHALVADLLKNRKYIGVWSWGERHNVRELTTGKIHQEDRRTTKRTSGCDIFLNWNLWIGEIFDRAQSLLAELKAAHGGNRRASGQLNGSSPNRRPRIRDMPAIGSDRMRSLWSSIIRGRQERQVLVLPRLQDRVCPCQTQLRRDLAEELILREIVSRILGNTRWQSLLLELTRTAWSERQRQRPERQVSLTSSLVDLDGRISRLVLRCETSDVPDLGNTADARGAPSGMQYNASWTNCKTLSMISRRLPAPEWIEEKLSDLRSLLQKGGPAAAHALRALVGGKVVVTEVHLPGKQRHYLQGRMQVHLGALAATTDVRIESTGSPAALVVESEEIVIDFRQPEPYEELAEPAKQLWDLGRTVKEIAQQLGCGRALITRALDHWYLQRGETPPDGRSLRKRLKGRRKAETLRDQIMELWQADVLVQDIASQLDCCVEIVHEAVIAWHEEQGLPVPDGRARRREVRLKNERKTA